MAQRSITSFFTKQAAPKPAAAASSPLKTSGTKALSTKQEPPAAKSPSPASSPAKAESPAKKPLLVKTYARKKKARVVEEDDEGDIELDFEPKQASPVKRPISDSESNDSPIKRCKRVRRAIESSDEEDLEEAKVKPDANDEVAEAKENLSNNSSAKKKASPKAKAKSTPQEKPATKRGRKSNKAKAEEEGNEEKQKPAKKTPKKKASPKKSKEVESEEAGKGEKRKSAKMVSPKKEQKDDEEEEPKTPPSAAKKSQGSHASFFKPKGKDAAESTASSDESGSKFSEALKRAQYHPADHAMWTRASPTPYQAFARTLEAIEGTSGRLKTIEILANYFRSVMVLTPSDLIPSVYMCLNRLAPEYEGIELGIGDMLLMKAIAQTTGRSLQQVRTDANKIGDLGEVAETSRGSQKTMFTPAPLTVPAVFAKLKEVSALSGQASTNNKVAKIQGLLVACRGVEARYLVRSLAGKLRIGLAEQSVLQALAHACVMTPPTGLSDSPSDKDLCAFKTSASDGFKEALEKEALALKTAYCECPNYDQVIPVLLSDGAFGLSAKCKLTPGIPLKPMLAHPTKGVQEVLSRFDKLAFTCEWKYDGERAQIHLSQDGKVSIYSRNQENNTSKYPDVVSRFKACVGDDVTTCVLDAEAVAWSREKAQILPFQILSTRKRKDAAETDIKVQVLVFAFDLLYLNGEALVRKSFRERRDLLKKHFKEIEGEFTFAKSADPETLEQVQEVLEESVKDSCEGLMVKTLDVDSTYEIAKRSRNWLKLKKDYLDGVGDTLDVVVMGGYLGKGKRTGNYGGFLLGCYDPDNEEYQTLCKIGTGFTDEDLTKHHDFFKDKIIEKPKSYYSFDSSLAPDHWFEPSQVWEIKAADLSVSPVHKAAVGLVDAERGVSLRFPRFVRVRDDKQPEDATTAQQVADMYKSQEQIKATTTSAGGKEDDFDF